MNNVLIANSMHPLTVLQDGKQVYVNLIQSPAALRIGKQPHILTLAVHLLQNSTVSGASVTLEYDLGKPIGNTDIVETTAADVVVYAKLIKQDLYTRFVKRKALATSSFLSVNLIQDTDGNYELRDVRIGKACPPQPGSDNETAASKQYWQNHAVVLEGQMLQHSTITKSAPY